MHDRERRELLLGLISAAIDQHDRWASRDDLVYVTAGVDEAMSDLVDGWAEGAIPGDCRRLEELVAAFGRRWREWQADVDRRGGSAMAPPGEEVWKAWEAMVECYRGVVEPSRPAIESVATLRAQQVPDRQICEIYGWVDARGRPETWRVEEELAEPGKHTRDWVDPVTRRRQETLERERSLAERIKSLRERKLKRMTAECPETLDELVAQGVPLGQIAAMLRVTEEEVLARCEAEGLPRPAVGRSVHAAQSPHEPELAEPVARQLAAREMERERVQEQPAAAADGLTLEEQIVTRHQAGLSTAEIAAELSTPERKVSRRKVQAVLKRYAEDPEAVAEMRHAQREYFRTRSQTALVAAKAAEARVDRLLRETAQVTLF